MQLSQQMSLNFKLIKYSTTKQRLFSGVHTRQKILTIYLTIKVILIVDQIMIKSVKLCNKFCKSKNILKY